jgi:hypothetical protein
MTQHERRPGRRLRSAAAGALAITLAGCGSSGGGASGVPDPVGPHPVVMAAQARGILDKVSTAAVAAVQPGGTAAAIGARLVGPERGLLTTDLRLPANLRPAAPASGVSWQRLLVPARSGWPRWFAAVGTTPSRTTPVLWVLTSSDARSPYGLWAELVMLPAARLPEVAKADVGAPELAPDTSGLLLAPKDVATRYADLLANGTSSPYAKTFALDVFRDQVLRKVAGDRLAAQQVQGNVTDVHTVQGVPLALRTSDGGALVIVALTETYTLKLPGTGGSVKVGDPVVATLAGKASFSRQVVETSTELVAFAVPPASAGGQVQVIAAAKGHLSVTGS